MVQPFMIERQDGEVVILVDIVPGDGGFYLEKTDTRTMQRWISDRPYLTEDRARTAFHAEIVKWERW